MPAFEAQEGMPYWQDLSTTNVTKSAYFYAKLLDWEISTDSYRIARREGLPVAGIVSQDMDAWVTYFFSRDLDGVTADVEKRGGAVLAVADVSLGRMALCTDPAGGVFGVIEPAGEDQFVAAGEPGTPVWHEYVAIDRGRECINFYAEVFDWEVAVAEGYYTATVNGAPFLGMRDESTRSDLGELQGVGGFWETYLGVADVRQAARRAEELGGEVLAGPELSPFGPLVVIADTNGATVTLCEVDPPVAEDELDEAESILR